MRTKIVKLYDLKELSEKAKQKALDDFTSYRGYSSESDAMQSLSKFAKLFNCDIEDVRIDWGYGRNWVKFDTDNSMQNAALMDEDPKDLSMRAEAELKKIIMSMGAYDAETLKGNGECVLTGAYTDEAVCDGARKAYFAGERDLKKILHAGFDSLMEACQKDFEYEQTMEYFEEACDANEYTFREDGTMDNGEDASISDNKEFKKYKDNYKKGKTFNLDKSVFEFAELGNLRLDTLGVTDDSEQSPVHGIIRDNKLIAKFTYADGNKVDTCEILDPESLTFIAYTLLCLMEDGTIR